MKEMYFKAQGMHFDSKGSNLLRRVIFALLLLASLIAQGQNLPKLGVDGPKDGSGNPETAVCKITSLKGPNSSLTSYGSFTIQGTIKGVPVNVIVLLESKVSVAFTTRFKMPLGSFESLRLKINGMPIGNVRAISQPDVNPNVDKRVQVVLGRDLLNNLELGVALRDRRAFLFSLDAKAQYKSWLKAESSGGKTDRINLHNVASGGQAIGWNVAGQKLKMELASGAMMSSVAAIPPGSSLPAFSLPGNPQLKLVRQGPQNGYSFMVETPDVPYRKMGCDGFLSIWAMGSDVLGIDLPDSTLEYLVPSNADWLGFFLTRFLNLPIYAKGDQLFFNPVENFPYMRGSHFNPGDYRIVSMFGINTRQWVKDFFSGDTQKVNNLAGAMLKAYLGAHQLNFEIINADGRSAPFIVHLRKPPPSPHT